MLRSLARLLSAAALALVCAVQSQAASVEELPRVMGGQCVFPGVPKCAVKVNFGSVCCGPDRVALRKITAYVEKSSDIKRALACPYGKEGDQLMCLVVTDRAKAKSVYSTLKHIVPPAGTGPSSRGVTTVTLED